jgi:hypothetical protein
MRTIAASLNAAGHGTLVSDVRCPSAGAKADQTEDISMGLGRGMLLWLIGVPIPIILLIAVLWHH